MTNEKIIYQVDAFTNEVFKGNPAGVMFVEDITNDPWMQQIAMEMNLSETAFVSPDNSSRNSNYKIRFFTPTKEISLCGHATLASAHLMYELGFVDAAKTILFEAKGGDLEITKDPDGIKMRFPKYRVEAQKIPSIFKSIVGFEPLEFYTSGDWVVAVAENEDLIADAQPNFEKLTKNELGHLLITAPSSNKDLDYVVRCFAPLSGINEDPVTGSAQCALVPIWNLKTGNTLFNVMQVSKRTGQLKVALVGDFVEIIGQAITVFKAELR